MRALLAICVCASLLGCGGPAPVVATPQPPAVPAHPDPQDALQSPTAPLGPIQVKLADVSSADKFTDGGPWLRVKLEIRNTSKTAKVYYRGWGKSLLSDTSLKDNLGNTYHNRTGPKQDPREYGSGSLYPEDHMTDALFFEPPVLVAEFLILTLPGDAIGQQGVIRFKIPKAMWAK